MSTIQIIDGILIVQNGQEVLYGHANPRPRHFRKARKIASQNAPATYRVEFVAKPSTPTLRAIKAIREITGVSLREAKDAVDAGTVAASGVSHDTAVRLEAALAEAGNQIRITQLTGGRARRKP